jgi:hypothetical protein
MKEQAQTWVVLAIVGAIFRLALVISGCTGWNPIVPGYQPVPACSGPTGYMDRIAGQINEALQDCYVCELQHRCYDVGNHYCCEGPMCAECRQSPVHFGRHVSDGGVR